MKRAKELSPAQLITTEALGDLEFQDGLFAGKLAQREDPILIEAFDREIQGIRLRGTQLKMLNAFKPFGYLTNTTRVIEALNQNPHNTDAFRSTFSRTLRVLEGKIPDSTIYQSLEETRSAHIRGIGCNTSLTPTDIALARLIYLLGQEGLATTHQLAQALFPHPESLQTEAYLQVNVGISKLRSKLPNSVNLRTERGADSFGVYRWENIFGF